MIVPKLYQCLLNKGDEVNLAMPQTGRGNARRSQFTSPQGNISGLGDVSHIDRASLSIDRGSVTEASATSDSRRPTEPDIAEESEDNFQDNM